MVHITEMNLKDYLYFIAKSLISFIMMLFKKPIQAIKKPEHLFAFGHIILLFGLLSPSGSSVTI